MYYVEIVIVLVLLLAFYAVFVRKENMAELAAPNFRGSLVDVYRDQIKDKKGMTVDDYALEGQLITGQQIPSEVRIL